MRNYYYYYYYLSRCSAQFNDFVAKCLIKVPKQRLEADQLTRVSQRRFSFARIYIDNGDSALRNVQHAFAASAGGPGVLRDIITEQAAIIVRTVKWRPLSVSVWFFNDRLYCDFIDRRKLVETQRSVLKTIMRLKRTTTTTTTPLATT